ncbi:MAG: ABC transporter ATP-binding protein [Candidatus Heimdallarchaeaceae archaeon]
MVSVKYENIGVAYGDFVVVENFNLEIPHGTLTTLLGPSGCGKTTVLRTLAGFVEPFAGKVYIGDKDITLQPPQKRNTAMIFQNYALWPHMTILKNVEYGLKLRESPEAAKLKKPWYAYIFWLSRPAFVVLPETYRRMIKSLKEEKETYLKKHKSIFSKFVWWLLSVWKGFKLVLGESSRDAYLDAKAKIDPKWDFRRKKVHEVLKLVHLEDQINKLPTQLSGGQQQRIALCRAIVVEPDVLLCDEPLSNLDAKLRKEIRTEIRSIIKKLGITTVYVTHDQEEALAISDRIAVLHNGIIQQYGTPSEVFSDPKTLFVAQFIGSSSTLEGKIIAPNLVELKGGEKIHIAVKHELEKGETVSLVIRPDSISVTQVSDYPIDIEINTIEYLGTEIKMTALLKDGSILLVDVAEQTDEYLKMKVGDKIKAYIKPNEVFVFKGEERIY